MKTLQGQSPTHLPSKSKKSREVKKLEGERDRALGRLVKLKSTRKKKKLRRQRQTLGRQMLNLTIAHTRALIEGEI